MTLRDWETRTESRFSDGMKQLGGFDQIQEQRRVWRGKKEPKLKLKSVRKSF